MYHACLIPWLQGDILLLNCTYATRGVRTGVTLVSPNRDLLVLLKHFIVKLCTFQYVLELKLNTDHF